MAKNLVIVESPAKAKTIEGYLGKDFVVKSSMGHIRDLAKGNDSVDIDNDFSPKYVVSPCLLYTSPSPRDRQKSRMPSSA